MLVLVVVLDSLMEYSLDDYIEYSQEDELVVCVSWPSGREVNNAWGQRYRVQVLCGAAFKFMFI